MGRLVEIQRHRGLASSYQCMDCLCPASYYPGQNYMTPSIASVLVQGTASMAFYAAYKNCNESYSYYNRTGWAAWSSQYTSIATVNSSGTITGQSGGSSSITAQYSDYKYTFNPIIFYCTQSTQAGNGNGTANVQVPGYVGVTGSSADTVQCGTSNFFARRLRVWYQVLDSSPAKAPILKAGMAPSEQLTWTSGVCSTSDGCGQKPTAATWSTDANGGFIDTIYNCSSTCVGGGSCDENWQQTFKVNGASVGIKNGSLTGTLNCIATNCTYTPQGTLH